MRDQWAGMGFTENILDKFLNLHCLETNAIEGTMHFSTSACVIGHSPKIHLIYGHCPGLDKTDPARLLQPGFPY